MLLGILIGILVWIGLIYINQKFNLELKHILYLILIFGFIFRVIFAFSTPTFYAPDEEPHFKYIKYLAEQKSLPVQKSKTNEPTKDWEYYQPPLYYLALSPIYSIAYNISPENLSLQVRILRFISILLSILVVFLTLKILNNLIIEDRFIKQFVISFVFLLPSYTFISSVINNDNLIIMIASAIIFLITKNKSIKNSIYLALLLGVAFLTKLSAFILLLGVIAFHSYSYLTKKSSITESLKHIFSITTISLLISLPLFLRNLQLYGDIIGESFVNVRKDWPSWTYGFLATLKYMVDSFWASAGITYNIEFLSGFSLLITACIICVLIYNFFKNREIIQNYLDSKLGDFLVPFLFTLLIEIFLVIRFGLLYEQGQGRFFYILLIPIAIIIGITINLLKFSKIKNINVHILGFFILYNSSFLSYCLNYYNKIS